MYRNFVKKLNRFNEGFIKLEKIICDILFVFLIFCLVAQVFYRFVLKSPAGWTEEFARYSFIFVMYLACGYTLHYGKHVDMNLLDTFIDKTKNPKRVYFFMTKVTNIANIVFCCYFISMFWPYLMKLKKLGRMIVSAPIPIWAIQSAVLIGFILMAWHSFVKLLQPYEVDDVVETK